MNWNDIFPITIEPDFSQISQYVGKGLWNELNEYVQKEYNAEPKIEYSRCSAAPGWNVKYKKGSRSICVMYPEKDVFSCMVTIGTKEATQTELFLPACTKYVQELYKNVSPCNNSRWLMINVTSKDILEDVKRLISIRMTKQEKGAKKMKICSYLMFDKNCKEAVEFYAEAFGVKKPEMCTYADMPQCENISVTSETKDLIMHTQLEIEGNTLMFADFIEDMPLVNGNNITLTINDDDLDKLKNVFEKLSSGGQVVVPLSETFWSKCYGYCVDKFGIGWQVFVNEE